MRARVSQVPLKYYKYHIRQSTSTLARANVDKQFAWMPSHDKESDNFVPHPLLTEERMRRLNSLADEAATLALAQQWASVLAAGSVVYLQGDLGAGKTCFSRGVIQALGHKGTVKSPTYTLVEDYPLAGIHVYHFDLYRLGDPEELEYMGIRDYLDGASLVLVEWPQRGQGILPVADLVLDIQLEGVGRKVSVSAGTDRGEAQLRELSGMGK